MLSGMSDYSTRNSSTSTSEDTAAQHSEPEVLQDMGNGAALEMMKVQGALGRAFNRIAGVSESNTSAEGLAFTNSDLTRYLEDHLKFAEGEWFRGTKIAGVADKIMEQLDADKDGDVTWIEFQTMVDEMRGHLIGEVGANASQADLQAKASELFTEMSGGAGPMGFETIEAQSADKLPADQEHKSLVAQLAALMVIDIVDLDEAEKEVRDRHIDQSEWMSAVNDFTSGG